jgi:TRAP-type C4-dicarboxylate transport system permease small subunit
MAKPGLLMRIYQYYNKIIEVASVVVLVFVTIVVFVSVASRYVFKTPLEWSEEIARYSFIWVVFLGIAMAEKSGDHFRIAYFIEKFPIRIRIVVEIALNLLIFWALYMLLLEGINYYNQGKSGLSTVVLMPLNYIYVALPLSVVLTILNRIETFILTLVDLVRAQSAARH